MKVVKLLPGIVLVALVFAASSFGQQSFMDEPGIPRFTTAFPVEHGFINLANGNLHIEIPIATYPQRGNLKPIRARLVYDSRIWSVGTEIINGGQFWQRSSAGGLYVGGEFRLVTEGEAGRSTFSQSTQQCGDFVDAGGKHHPQYRTTFENYTYQEPNGTNHRMNIDRLYLSSQLCTGGGQVPTGSGSDASGYKMVVDDNNITVYEPDGTRVTPLLTSTSATVSPGTSMVQDTNGNYFTYANGSAPNTTNVVDSLGRIPVLTSFSNNQTFIDYLCEQGCNPTGGDRARITLNITYIPIATQFNAIYQGSGVREASGSVDVLDSIVLPDNTSYHFQYDSYGEMTGITLPTGGQVTYGYANFTDYTGYTNRWVTSRTVDGNLWSFPPTLPACSTPPCPLIVNVTTPPYNDGTSTASDNYVYTYAVSNGTESGAWITQEQYFHGSTSGTPVLTKTTDYGYVGACPAFSGSAGQGLEKIRETITWPTSGTLSKKAEYCYDNFHNLTTSKMWDYQPNGNFAAAPDREIDNSYKTDTADAAYTNANIVNLLKTTTTKGAGGNQVSQTTYGYDETALQPSGVTTNLATPTAPRANRTSVSRWLNTSTSPVVSNTAWYDSGEVYQSKDPLQHTTTTYFDSTGAYPNKICNALNQCSYQVHDFNTGLMTSFTDVNGSQAGDPTHTTSYTFDTLLRPLCTNLPDGGQTCLSYPDANHVSRQQIITASLPPDTSTTVFDGLGRVSQTQHTLPAGVSKVDTTYDPVGAVFTVSNPYFTTADPTYGVTQSFHDTLSRGVKTIKQDGSVSSAAYSARNSGTANGTCITTTDEAGKQRMACHNGFGELVEVDEPNALAQATNATASVSINGALQETIITGGTPHAAAAGSPLSSIVMPDGSAQTFYYDANQHVNHFYWSSSNGWTNEDVTVITAGATPAGTGSGLTSTVMNDGSIHVFYIGSNQHIYQLYWYSNGGWTNQDITAITGTGLAAVGSKLTAVAPSSGPIPLAVFYEATNQHIYQWYWSPTPGWQNQDLSASTSNTAAAVGSAITSGIMNDGSWQVFYIGSNQHVYQLACCGPAWNNYDITSFVPGSLLPAVGSSLTMLTPPAGAAIPIIVLYEGTNQHIDQFYWSSGVGWQNQDITSFTGNVLASSGSALTSTIASGNWYVGYVGAANQHVYVLSCCGPGWANADLNVAAGSTVTAGSGSGQSSVGAANSLYMHEFYLGGNQHVYDIYYNAGLPGWQTADLTGTSKNVQLDAGTVSLTVGSFTATVCFGNSTNPACTGKPVNYSASDVANALVQALNVTGSPVSAAASGSSINMTWLQPGAFSPSAAPLSSSHDNPALFPNNSFSSAATTFSGGQSAPFDSTSYSTTYQYDGLGNLLRVDQKGSAPSDSTQWRTRTFVYDSLSRLLTATNPESGTITYAYDNDGEVLMKTSPAPNQNPVPPTQTVSYCYDALHRVTARDYSAHTYTPPACPITAPVVSYVYDSGANGKGHLTSLADQAGSGIYGYDNMGRVITETRVLTGANNGAISKSASYEYNLNGSLYKLHYPSGAVVTYTPGAASLTLSAIDTGNSINYVTNATYGADSSLTGFVSGNSPTFTGITNAFGFNRRLQPLTMSATAPSQTVFSIGYDFHAGTGSSGFGTDNGNVWGIINYKDQTRNQTFSYDPLNRLTSAQNAGTDCSVLALQGKTKFWGNSYVYDAWGNLLQKNITKCSAEHLLATADAQNRIHVPTPDYVYDAAGNMTTNVTDGVTSIYDPENRISTATSNSITTTYTYDSDGNRVRKSTGNLAANGTLYWYLTPGVVSETDLAGTTQSEYIFFDGERVARRDGATGTGGVFYYFSDDLKTASVITDSAGVIKVESDYYPWGGELQFVNNDSNHYKFTGKERDSETGLDYFGARYYSNGLGRFVSPDPLLTTLRPENPQTFNRYAYTLNNPVRYVDRNGLYEEDVHRDLTTVLALAAGFDSNAAAAIGAADQGVDTNPQTSPFSGTQARKDYHFTTPDRREQLWNAFEASGSENDLGIYMHAEQDSFSHEGFGPKMGHLFAGHAPDKTYNDAPKADRMANDTYSKLVAAADKMGISKDNRVAWNKIDKLVGNFNRAKTKEEKQKILAQIRETIRKAQEEQQKAKNPKHTKYDATTH